MNMANSLREREDRKYTLGIIFIVVTVVIDTETTTCQARRRGAQYSDDFIIDDLQSLSQLYILMDPYEKIPFYMRDCVAQINRFG